MNIYIRGENSTLNKDTYKYGERKPRDEEMIIILLGLWEHGHIRQGLGDKDRKVFRHISEDPCTF